MTGPLHQVTVLVSSRRHEELLWNDGRWGALGQRAVVPLDDHAVRRAFGDEPFRRLERYAVDGDAAFQPRIAEMVGRRPIAAAIAVGWALVTDDAERATISRARSRIDVYDEDGWIVIDHCEGNALTGRGRVDDLGVIEDVFIDLATTGRRPSELSTKLYWHEATDYGGSL